MNIFLLPRLVGFLRNHWVLTVSALLALITMIIVPPDGQYLDYIDWKTLGCLFSVLAVANAFRLAGAFDRIARIAIEHLSSPASVVMTLVLTTGALSMVATNDLALIVMLPITLIALVKAGWSKLIAATFVMEGLAANLCGMIMPFGNPQNLYLYSYYAIGFFDFLTVMAPPFIVATCLIIATTWALVKRAGCKPEPVAPAEIRSFDRKRLGVYGALFVLAILAVFRILPVLIAVGTITTVLLIFDRQALKAVDYPLLLTFVCFFIFAGNMTRMTFLNQWLTDLMAQDSLLTSVLLSQIISNVPAAVLLSHFTGEWPALLTGVNVGGAGTLVASLASLITLCHFTGAKRLFPNLASKRELSTGYFLKLFTGLNLGFLLGLLAFSYLWSLCAIPY